MVKTNQLSQQATAAPAARAARRVASVGLLAALVALCMVLGACSQGPVKESFMGVWHLAFSEGDQGQVMVHSEADMESYRSNGMDITLDLMEEDQGVYSELGVESAGTWAVKNGKLEFTFADDRVMTGTLLDEGFLETELDGVKFHFEQFSDDESDSSSSADDTSISMADENGLSILMDEGEKLAEEVVVADDENVRLVIDGTGVAPTGDPGYNLQIENKSDQPISVWVNDPFKVGQKDVMVYMYNNLSANESTTTFMQFDSDQLGATSVDALVDVKGTIQVDDVNGNELGAFEVEM